MYVLARIGGTGESGWLAISYVPDSANVRGKVSMSVRSIIGLVTDLNLVDALRFDTSGNNQDTRLDSFL